MVGLWNSFKTQDRESPACLFERLVPTFVLKSWWVWDLILKSWMSLRSYHDCFFDTYFSMPNIIALNRLSGSTILGTAPLIGTLTLCFYFSKGSWEARFTSTWRFVSQGTKSKGHTDKGIYKLEGSMSKLSSMVFKVIALSNCFSSLWLKHKCDNIQTTRKDLTLLPKIAVTLNVGFLIYLKDWWSYFQRRPEEDDIQKASSSNN